MATKTKRKRKPSNITTLDTSKISLSAESRWLKEVYDFTMKLSKHETKLMKELLLLVIRKPTKSETPCEVINFFKGRSGSRET